MEQRLIDVLRQLPIAIRIMIQIDLEGNTWYLWQGVEMNGKSQDFVEAVDQALTSVFVCLATEAEYNPEGFKQISPLRYN